MRERGKGRFGLLVSTAALALALFATYKTAPVYLAKVEFEEELDRISRRAAVEFQDNRVITQQVLRSGRGHGFELTTDDVGIQRSSRRTSNPKLLVTVHYIRRVPFPGYTHMFDFTTSVESMVGSF